MGYKRIRVRIKGCCYNFSNILPLCNRKGEKNISSSFEIDSIDCKNTYLSI